MTYINPQRNPYEDNPYINFLNKYRSTTDNWSIPILGSLTQQNLTFSEALYHLKKGKKVKRKGWDSYLKLDNESVPPQLYKTLSQAQKDLLYNFIKDGKAYNLTKEDILAEDWELSSPKTNDITVTC